MKQILAELMRLDARVDCDATGEPVMVDLRGTAVTDEFLRRLSALTSLRDLRLPVQTTDEGVERLEGLSGLEALDLSYAAVGDLAAEHVRRFAQLRTLQLAYTRVTDQGLERLAGLESLKAIDLRGVRVGREALAAFARRLPTCVIRHGLHSRFPVEPTRRHAFPSLAVTTFGRLWLAWNSTPPTSQSGVSNVALATSRDQGATWRGLPMTVGPTTAGPGVSHTPRFWMDPQKRLWLMWTLEHRGTSVWGMMTERPDDDSPRWTLPRKIADGSCVGPPCALARGGWILPTYSHTPGNSTTFWRSIDAGATWEPAGSCPSFTADANLPPEAIVLENQRGLPTFWTSTLDGIVEFQSRDAGSSWFPIDRPPIPHDGARFALSHVTNSGRLVLVKTGGPAEHPASPERLTVSLSEDGGESWHVGLVVDERHDVSKPSLTQDDDGLIYIVYEHEKSDRSELHFAILTEEDLLEHAVVSRESRLRGGVIIEPLGKIRSDRQRDRGIN